MRPLLILYHKLKTIVDDVFFLKTNTKEHSMKIIIYNKPIIAKTSSKRRGDLDRLSRYGKWVWMKRSMGRNFL